MASIRYFADILDVEYNIYDQKRKCLRKPYDEG